MAAQVALRRQQAREENEARELGLLYGCHEGLLAMHRAGFTFSAAMAHMLSGRRGGNEQTTTTSSSTAPSTPPPDWKRLSPSDPSPPSAAPSPKRPRLDDDPDDQPSPPDPYDDDERSKDPPSPPPPPPPPPSQEPLDLHHPSSPKKSPVDILARVFPRENRSILNVVLQRNGGDVLQAIDDLLSSKEPPQEAEASSVSPRPREPPLPGFLNPHSFFPAAPGPFRRPYASPPSSAAAAAAARGLLAVPAYSGFFPGIAPSFAPGYPNFFGTSSASSTSTTPDECKKKECWNTCGNPSPQDLSSPDTKSPNGYND